MAFIILQQILVMSIFMLIGFLLYKGGKITEAGSKSMANMLAFAVIPSTIINGFCVDFSAKKLAELGFSFLMGLLVLFIAGVISAVIFRQSGVEQFAASFSNAGFIGIPLIRAAIGDVGVFYLVGLLVPFNIIQWTWGISMLLRGQPGKKQPQTSLVKKFLLNPIVIASFAGLIIFLSGRGSHLPAVISNSISGVAALNAPLAMMVLGVYLAQTRFHSLLTRPRLYAVSAVRLLLIPIATVGVMALLPVDPAIRMTMIIAGAAPVGANVAVYSQIYDADYVYACEMVTQSTLLSIVCMPVIIALASYAVPM